MKQNFNTMIDLSIVLPCLLTNSFFLSIIGSLTLLFSIVFSGCLFLHYHPHWDIGKGGLPFHSIYLIIHYYFFNKKNLYVKKYIDGIKLKNQISNPFSSNT